MSTTNIINYLQTAYTDEGLSALKAHTEDGKLSYLSCCCFIGAATANHALQEKLTTMEAGQALALDGSHLSKARHQNIYGKRAEKEFYLLAVTDEERRAKLLPLVEDEIKRRDDLKGVLDALSATQIPVTV